MIFRTTTAAVMYCQIHFLRRNSVERRKGQEQVNMVLKSVIIYIA